MTKVFLRQGESPENLLKWFRKKVTRDRILSEAKKKRYFVSKSKQRRIALRKARRRFWLLETKKRFFLTSLKILSRMTCLRKRLSRFSGDSPCLR